jgi:hypothetical protein
MRLKACLAAAALVALAGCAQIVKVEPGQVTVKETLRLTTTSAWNRFELQFPLSVAPGASEVWTQDGITLDALAFFVGVAQGQTLGSAIPGTSKTLPQFRSTMTPGEIVELYEQMVTQDGSAFTLKRVAPGRFGGQPGFRFEHTITRKSDNVLLKGVAQGAVVKDKLYLVAFTAPSIYYFDRHAPQVEPLLASAEIRAP